MYSFNGEFRRKPIQSLGGASKNVNRFNLLTHAASERQKREDVRRRNTCATKIQSYYRRHLSYQKLCKTLRKEYEDICKLINERQALEDIKIIGELFQKLIVFYKPCDHAELVSLNQILNRRQTLVAKAIVSRNYVWTYRIQKLLLMNLNFLTDDKNSSLPIASPMRVIETFTNLRTYEKVSSSNSSHKVMLHIFSFLINNGYFTKLKRLILLKVPDSLIESTTPPTELASSIFNLVLIPTNEVLLKDAPFRLLLYKNMFEAFFSVEFAPQISCFVLPSIVSSQNLINFSHILDSLYDEDDDKVTVTSSIQILYSILKFFKAKKCALTNVANHLKYVFLISHLCKSIPPIISENTSAQYGSDDEEDMELDVSTQSSCLIEECIEILNEGSHVNFILSMFDAHEKNRKLTKAVSRICYSLFIHRKLAVHNYRLLYSLAFKPSFLRQLWESAASSYTISIFGSKTSLLNILARGFNLNSTECDLLLPHLAVFCSLFSYLLVTVHDSEFENKGTGNSIVPFTLSELLKITITLKDVSLGLIELAYPDTKTVMKEDYKQVFGKTGTNYELENLEADIWLLLFRGIVGLVRQVHARDTRRQFCPENHWLSNRVSLSIERLANLNFAANALQRYRPFRDRAFTNEELEDEGPPLTTNEVRTLKILRELPFVLSFTDRIKIFRHLIKKDKIESQSMSDFLRGPMIRINIRRDYIYEDAFDRLSPRNEDNLKLKIIVQLTNALGLDEAGIDGGGIFREFLTVLLKTGFDPNRGFFKTTSDRLLYPNSQVHLIVDNFNEHFYFLGRMLGKAIYENMLVELPFAEFFLSKLLGRQSTSVDIHHLNSLDPILYKNLLYLKNYEGDVSSLGIDFTVTNSELGEMQTVELKSNGSDIAVTSSNAIEYIHLVSDYKLNKQIQEQSSAFKKGLGNIINLEWLQMFDYRELQVLISGASVPIDVNDLRKNTEYGGNYTSEHPVIVKFWSVVYELDQEQLKKLIKFVTSCSHPPLLGFKELYPSFCIQTGGNQVDRLPTASTCMNLLKLPEFQDEETLKEKLLYAIESESGFELS